MEPLIGKYIQATHDISLLLKWVDGRLIKISSWEIPQIKKGWVFKVKDCRNGNVILQNLSSKDWLVCEVTEDEIEDFKVIPEDKL